GYCNTKEAGIGSTTPAGRFSPRGDSPYGCVDMAGNVYDWTASWYDEEEGWRVLRGGSWSFEQDLASTTYRDGTPHVDRTNDIGFRLVRRFPPGTAAPTEI
ncbi:MAG: formylglycine-generating enzyme family protein, partial [Candidatus Promineifilaceae bacterium]